jgi:hypothetical protein
VLHVYYLVNLLSNVPCLASTPSCQFFTCDAIDRISNLDRHVLRDESRTFDKLLVSKTYFVLAFIHFLSLYC